MADIHEGFKATDYRTHPIRAAQYWLVELLRANVAKVQKRVYPPGITQNAQMPRVTVASLSPTEKRWIGENGASGTRSRFTIHNFKIDCWSKVPQEVDEVADQVGEAIFRNRAYKPSDLTKGEFMDMRFQGGSETTFNSAHQIYQRTINIEAWWHSKGTPY